MGIGPVIDSDHLLRFDLKLSILVTLSRNYPVVQRLCTEIIATFELLVQIRELQCVINSLTFSWNNSNIKKGLNEFLGRICPKFLSEMFIQLFF